jgi:hypothetical protein
VPTVKPLRGTRAASLWKLIGALCDTAERAQESHEREWRDQLADIKQRKVDLLGKLPCAAGTDDLSADDWGRLAEAQAAQLGDLLLALER